jgi:hypothetical protein
MALAGTGRDSRNPCARRCLIKVSAAAGNPDLKLIARSKSTSQIHQHGQSESPVDQLSFEPVDPAAFERGGRERLPIRAEHGGDHPPHAVMPAAASSVSVILIQPTSAAAIPAVLL